MRLLDLDVDDDEGDAHISGQLMLVAWSTSPDHQLDHSFCMVKLEEKKTN